MIPSTTDGFGADFDARSTDRRTGAGLVNVDDMGMASPFMQNGQALNWRLPPELSGGLLRYYTEGASDYKRFEEIRHGAR